MYTLLPTKNLRNTDVMFKWRTGSQAASRTEAHLSKLRTHYALGVSTLTF